MRQKIKEIGWYGMYVPYRIGSHAVHGSWVVLMRHLVYSDEGFSVESSFGFADRDYGAFDAGQRCGSAL